MTKTSVLVLHVEAIPAEILVATRGPRLNYSLANFPIDLVAGQQRHGRWVVLALQLRGGLVSGQSLAIAVPMRTRNHHKEMKGGEQLRSMVMPLQFDLCNWERSTTSFRKKTR